MGPFQILHLKGWNVEIRLCFSCIYRRMHNNTRKRSTKLKRSDEDYRVNRCIAEGFSGAPPLALFSASRKDRGSLSPKRRKSCTKILSRARMRPTDSCGVRVIMKSSCVTPWQTDILILNKWKWNIKRCKGICCCLINVNHSKSVIQRNDKCYTKHLANSEINNNDIKHQIDEEIIKTCCRSTACDSSLREAFTVAKTPCSSLH